MEDGKEEHDAEYWDNGSPLIPNCFDIAFQGFENLCDTVKNGTPQQLYSFVQKPSFLNFLSHPSLSLSTLSTTWVMGSYPQPIYFEATRQDFDNPIVLTDEEIPPPEPPDEILLVTSMYGESIVTIIKATLNANHSSSFARPLPPLGSSCHIPSNLSTL